MPQPGDILCHKEFEFEDGTKKAKLFVVLNATDSQMSRPLPNLRIPFLKIPTTKNSCAL